MIGVAPAHADSKPSDPSNPKTPVTVSADVLATPQIDGVVWDQVVVGNTVYVGGKFATARPAGAAAGKSTVARSNLLAYNLTTGELLPFAPAFNGQVKTLAVSPDKKTLYVGGDYTTVTPAGAAAVTRTRLAAFTVSNGSLVAAFNPTINSVVTTVAVSSQSVFVGGWFTKVGTTQRSNLAALAPSTGAVQKWAPVPAGGNPRTMVISPDEKKVVVGGDFTSLNGSSDPGFGVGAVTADTGTSLPWKVNSVIRNGGPGAAVYSLSSDANSVYATAFSYKAAIQSPYTEGTYAARWSDGELVWHEDCHGDTYSSAPAGNIVYTAGHAHDCERVGGFGSYVPSKSSTMGFHRALAFTNAATGTLKPFTGELYTNFGGQPSPSLLDWYPYFNPGQASGQGQATWDVTVAGDYVLYGGEFTQASGKAQQGLARFQVPSKAPNLRGPELTDSDMAPRIQKAGPGSVRVSWAANYDPDNADLRYELYRDDATKPIATLSATSRFWDRPVLEFVDNDVPAGKTVTYKVKSIDPFGNSTTGATMTLGAYDRMIQDDAPSAYWPLNELDGSRGLDMAGTNDMAIEKGAKRKTTGVENKTGQYSTLFPGKGGDPAKVVAGGVARDRTDAPGTVSTELWFSSKTPGRLLDFADQPAEPATGYDASLELQSDGRLSLAMTSNRAIFSPEKFADGAWHHVVVTLGPQGSTLVVDGVVRASDTANEATRPIIAGSWRLANGFPGQVDNVAVYPRILTAAEITNHYTAAKPRSVDPSSLTAYDRTVLDDKPVGYWPLNESSGVEAYDYAGTNDISLLSSVTRKSDGVASGYSSTFTGADASGVARDRANTPVSVSTELWFSSTRSGRLLDIADQPKSAATGYDLALDLRADGRLSFAMTSNTAIATENTYNDGKWHHVVLTLGPTGSTIQVDGVVRASSSTSTSDRPIIAGSWRLANGFTGTIDNVAVYDRVLSAADIAEHSSAGRTAA